MERIYDQNQIIGNARKGIPPIIPVSNGTFWTRVKNGTYPPGFKYGSRRYWTESDVEQMVDVMKSGEAVA